MGLREMVEGSVQLGGGNGTERWYSVKYETLLETEQKIGERSGHW